MIKLKEITQENRIKAASLSIKYNQKDFAAPVIGIQARGYVYRSCNAKVYAIKHDDIIVGKFQLIKNALMSSFHKT